MFWYNKKKRAITHLKGVITPGIFGKGKTSIKLETVVCHRYGKLNWAMRNPISTQNVIGIECGQYKSLTNDPTDFIPMEEDGKLNFLFPCEIPQYVKKGKRVTF
jgi:hypothetical protein